ncbi:hypothetical protein UT300005_07160 [Clostridium sp. CTA-5]
MIYCIYMANYLNVDLEKIINSKMNKNEKKYPIEKSKGNMKKYTEL